MADSLRQALDRRLAQLKTERSRGWESSWRDLADFIEPRTGRWQLSDSNEGKRKDQFILNNRARLSLRTMKAGMMSGITSVARPWFKLATPDPDLMEFAPVKVWLHQAEQIMRELFVKSNLYNALPQLYGECGLYGTASMFAMPDERDMVRFYPFTVGSYYLASSSRLQVDTIYREFRMTARQMIQQFGKDKVSVTVLGLAESNPESWVNICHAIEPRSDRQPERLDSMNMPFRSVYWEKGGDSDRVLRESGFREFPGMAPRWDLLGEDVYGTGPGDIAIGDARGMQLMEKRKLELLDKGVRPPMTAPQSMRNQKASIVPGDISYVDVMQGGQGFVPTYVPDPTWFSALRSEINEHERRIEEAFFYDLFLMVSRMDTVRTATEIAARQEEKMLQLGPVLERLNDELLDPLIDRTFSMMIEQSAPIWAGLIQGSPLLPPPPQELGGMDLRVEYISILAQAQKALGVNSIERTLSFAGNLAGLEPSVMDKLDLDQAMDEYTHMIGAPPNMLRDDEAVAEIRRQRAEAQQEQQAMEQMGAGIQGAKLLSETDVTSPSALTAMTTGGGV